MSANYVLLETIEVTQSVASVTFDNIPQTGYTDLVIKSSSRGNGSFVRAEFNGDTGANYSARFLRGNGSTAASATQTFVIPDVTNSSSWTANIFSNSEIYIPNYNVSGISKSASTDLVSENNATENYMALVASHWTGTDAITSIRIFPGSDTLAAGSTFSLYGVAALGTTPTIAPLASGGNIVANDGTYWYHAFLSSGSFTPAVNLSCDVMTIAGGGGGFGGGGGAGGFRVLTAQSLATNNYTVTIGAGGTGGGTSGTNTTISGTGLTTISATGGGRGGYQNNGIAGGSGGGGHNNNNIARVGGSGNAGSYSPSEGNAGGNAAAMSINVGGGGGGAGAVGANSTSSVPAAGGNGTSTYSSWGAATGTGQNISGTYWYAGGGSGSDQNGNSAAGGNGGGGQGDRNPNTGIRNDGLPNMGAGGGGGYFAIYGNGGSGIVIVRYAMA